MLVAPAVLLTTHVYVPSSLLPTLVMVIVLVVPDTPPPSGKSAPSRCHLYLSGTGQVIAAIVNTTCDPGNTGDAGCWVT